MQTETGRVFIARPDSMIADYVIFFCTNENGHLFYYVRHSPEFWDDRNAIGRWLRTKLFPDYHSARYSITYYEEHCKEIRGDEYGYVGNSCPACNDEGCIACAA